LSPASPAGLFIWLRLPRSPIERHHRQRYDPAMSDLSDDPRDKLQAALNHSGPDPDDDLSADYRDACGKWFAGLSEPDKSIVARISEAYGDGNEAKVDWLALQLPPAPRCPP
jgi:hypothetical protein